MIGGVAAGTVMMISAPNKCDAMDSSCEHMNSTLLYGGLGTVIVGAFAGWLMTTKGDEAQVRVVGGVSPNAQAKPSPSLGLTGAF